MTINYLAVLLATIASWFVGAAWYGVLGKVWAKAVGWKEGDKKPSPAVPMAVSFLAELVMAFMLAGLIGHHIAGTITLRTGLTAGGFSWLAFVVTTQATNNAFQGKPWLLTVIDGGHWLLVLLVQGLIIAAMA
jgi:hypothetical protein